MKLPNHKTKIVATIGPASESQPVLEQLIVAGMNVARLNFSHGDFTRHGGVIERIRAAEKAVGLPVTILADLPGPKMRIGTIQPEPIELRAGDFFTLTTETIDGDARRVSVSFERLPQVVRPGDKLFLNDGLVQLEVVSADDRDVECRVLVGGELRSRKGLNLPGIKLGVRAFTDHDAACMEFALRNGVDAVSQSFVETAADIEAVREAAKQLGFSPFIIAKIERADALEHVDAIFQAADGMMIARGDLGVEIPLERIAIVQKELMRKAAVLGKPVITATQMLESMVSSRLPTRAEATDVANAVLDGTDCVMLSAESAMGRFPVDAVAMLGKIAATAEPYRDRRFMRDMLSAAGDSVVPGFADVASLAVENIVDHAKPAAVVVPTCSGQTARMIARFRLPIWVAAVCEAPAVAKAMQLSYGVVPIVSPEPADWSQFARDWVRQNGLPGKSLLLVAGPSAHNPHANHRIEGVAIDGQ